MQRLATQLAKALGVKTGAALDARAVPSPLSLGIPVLDELLGGGLPRGRIVEVTGVHGRMSFAVAGLAAASRAGELAAIVDANDRLDPRALTAAGADLARILWVRPGSLRDALRAADLVLDAGGFGLLVLAGDGAMPQSAVWARLAHRAERSRAAVLVALSQRAVGTFAAAALAVEEARARFRAAPGGRQILFGADLRVRLLRSKTGGRPRPGADRVALLKRK